VRIISHQVLEALQSYNETEVRFHVIDPIVRKLGYPGGDDVYLKLAEKLDYPYFHIGHKSKKKDLPLGFPDYRAGLKGARGSFIVEAKAGNIVISQKDVEQAHSYAAHAQVGANYFVLCDGTMCFVYATLSGPDCSPVVEIPIGEIDDRFHELENVLSPICLAKNCHVKHDTNLKLCDGVGSSVEIHSGEYGMDHWAYRAFVDGTDYTDILRSSVPQFAEIDRQLTMLEREFELKIGDGLAKRDSDGRISASVGFPGVTKNNLAGMKLLGIDRMTFSTNERFISTDQNSPTLFESTADFSLAKGSMVAPLFGQPVQTDADLAGDVFVSAQIHMSGDAMLGEYVALADYRLSLPQIGAMTIELDICGRFSLRLIV
jgi:Type I restriction enzyme R protein N terminus (HSDR_N)